MKDGNLTWRELLEQIQKFPDDILDDVAGTYDDKTDMIHPFRRFVGVLNDNDMALFGPFLEHKSSRGYGVNVSLYEEYRN
jgi:hypothetical protein